MYSSWDIVGVQYFSSKFYAKKQCSKPIISDTMVYIEHILLRQVL